MVFSDRSLGILGLTTSLLGLGYLFVRLFIIPLLPLDENHPLNLESPVYILQGCGFFGLLFIGSLSVYTLLKLYCARNVCKKIQ